MGDLKIPEFSIGYRYQEVESKIVNKVTLKDWQIKVASEFQLDYYSISNPAKPFIRIGNCIDSDGQDFLYAARKGEHSQDSLCFCWHRGQIYMAIRLGVRASLSGWDK